MPKLEYKVYPSPLQTASGNQVYYGLVLNKPADPATTLREVMAYKKITAFEPSAVQQLFDSVIQGAMELTALDGQPRVIGGVLRTHLAWDSSFPSVDTDPKSIGMNVRLRTLKELKIPVDTSGFEFVAPSGLVWPKMDRVFPITATAPTQTGTLVKGQAIVVQGVNLAVNTSEGITSVGFSLVDPLGVGNEINLDTTSSNYYRTDLAYSEDIDALPPGTERLLRLEASIDYGTSSMIFVAEKPVTIVAAS